MKKFFIYFSGVLYSVKECLLTWKMPKRYPIIAFILSFFMLFSPIQFGFLFTPTSSLINQVPKNDTRHLEIHDIKFLSHIYTPDLP